MVWSCLEISYIVNEVCVDELTKFFFPDVNVQYTAFILLVVDTLQ